MKQYLFVLIAFSLMAGTSCQTTIDIEKEKEAIIAVIETERDAYYEGDLDRMEAAYYHDPVCRKMTMKVDTIYLAVGWSEISAKIRSSMTPEKVKDREDVAAEYLKYEINIYGNTALVYHDVLYSGMWKGQFASAEEKRILHLQKIDGEWKINLMARNMLPLKLE